MVLEMIRRRRLALIAFCAFGMLFLAGCGPKRVPAGGTVELDGKPLEGGILYFNPDESKGNTAKVSCTSPVRNGKFELRTDGVERSDSGTGVPPGWYKVYVRVNQAGEPPLFPGPAVVDINPIYLDPAKTPLQIEVVGNAEKDRFDLKMTSK